MIRRTYGITRFVGPAAVASMTRICLLGLAAQIAMSGSSAQSTQAAGSQQPLPIDREKEIALALSACPASAAGGAGAYVLEKSGYVKVRDSQNGFTAIVQHSQPTSQEPQCMDAEGARTFLPRYLKVAELRAQGKTPEEIKQFVAEAFAKGVFQAPTRPGVDYMLSTENITPDGKGGIVRFPPHVMFYGPYLTNADLGSDGNLAGPAFVAGEGSPHALIIVPVGTRIRATLLPISAREARSNRLSGGKSFKRQEVKSGTKFQTGFKTRRKIMSEFLFLYRGGESGRSSPEVAQQTMQKWMGWMKDLAAKGHIKDQGHPLERAGKLVKGQKKVVTDGPYAETKDIVGGYTLIQAKDLSQATELSQSCPIFEFGGSVEVRPIMQLSM